MTFCSRVTIHVDLVTLTLNLIAVYGSIFFAARRTEGHKKFEFIFFIASPWHAELVSLLTKLRHEERITDKPWTSGCYYSVTCRLVVSVCLSVHPSRSCTVPE